MSILYFLLLLSVIIVIHELGHLFAAKLFGVYCYEFSFGMGPVIFQKKGKETAYSIRALPIGGFVAMAGEVDQDEAYPDVVVPEGRRMTQIKTYQKIIIMLAGVMMNFLLAWLIFSFSILSVGTYRQAPKAIVGSVMEGSIAQTAGFQVGDVITSVEKADGTQRKVDTFLDVQVFLSEYHDEITYHILRQQQPITIQVTPTYNEQYQQYMVGIQAVEGKEVKVNLINCWYYGILEMGMIMKMMIQVILGLFHGQGLNQLSGPVGIYQATKTYASMGFRAFMLLIAQLSLNVGIFNLLPLPVLDGGQVVITSVEALVKRTLPEKIKLAIMLGCWVLLIGLMVFSTWNDIQRLF